MLAGALVVLLRGSRAFARPPFKSHFSSLFCYPARPSSRAASLLLLPQLVAPAVRFPHRLRYEPYARALQGLRARLGEVSKVMVTAGIGLY